MSQTIKINVKDASPMNAYVAMPEGKGPFPAVMVFQEAFGVNDHMRHVTDRIAREGYIAIAPELFHRTAPAGFEGSYSDFAAVMPHFQALTTETLADDCQATYDWLMAQDNVTKDKIGSIGFCLGGRVSFIANTALPLAAAVSFYGGGMHTITDRVVNASAPHLMFWGGKDTHILPEHVDQIVAAFKEAGKDYTNVVISYAEHAFSCDARPSYNRQASEEAWGMTMAYFKNKLVG